ncbi:MAG: sulfatase-like hydrolase/transferase, partial [Planctomycetota bacterium]
MPATAAENAPTILTICVDHWPGSLLGAAGHPTIQTPTLDQLCRNGVRYTNAYTECPVCIPARRTLMTGTSPRFHGDRVYRDRLLMPDVPSLAQTFRDAGYQATAVGKLHVYPQRDRIGFDDVILAEEGRYQYGCMDDYQIWLNENGYAGQEFGHGMGNNQYETRPWHLPEEAHPTTWATREMVRAIRRRDPRRPGFYYLSYCYPHPPLVPLQSYLDMYRDPDLPIDMPYRGDWTESEAFPVVSRSGKQGDLSDVFIRNARRAFYAQ